MYLVDQGKVTYLVEQGKVTYLVEQGKEQAMHGPTVK